MVNWTNKHQIDPVIAEAIMNDDYEAVGDISATGLLKPPQMMQLQQEHEAEITQDVSDSLWLLLGRAVHYILNQGTKAATSQELRLSVMLDDWEVSGQFDVYYGDTATLKDYKVTSVWAYIFGGKSDWEQQLNIYAYLAQKNGTAVERLAVAAILRDHNKRQASTQSDYPDIPFVEIDYPLWGMEQTERFIRQRVALHQDARAGRPVPECTPAERWAQPEKFAVIKHKAKRALRVFPSRFKAQACLDAMSPVKAGEYKIDHRRGTQTRCESYCPVVKWCEQAKKLGVGQDAEQETA